jgi:hypothetical protein
VSASGQCWQVTGGTLAFLSGSWQAERELTDHRSGQRGRFRGIATLAAGPGWPPAGPAARPPDGAGPGVLCYHEQGELRFGGHVGPASRSLLYRPGPDGAAEVLFADGRPFYVLDLRSGYWQAEHPCGTDRYLVTVRVLGPDRFTEQWQTRGPGKDYEMTTSLSRLGAAE